MQPVPDETLIAEKSNKKPFKLWRRPELKVETTTLWDYPSQHYGLGQQGDKNYRGATPSYVIWNCLQRYTREIEFIRTNFREVVGCFSPLSEVPVGTIDFHLTPMGTRPNSSGVGVRLEDFWPSSFEGPLVYLGECWASAPGSVDSHC